MVEIVVEVVVEVVVLVDVEVVVLVDVDVVVEVVVLVGVLVERGWVLATSIVVAGADELAAVVASGPQAPVITAAAIANSASCIGRCTVRR